MAAKPLTSEAVAFTEKKMDMTLDDIIKMSNSTTKAKKQRVPNKSLKNLNNTARDKSAKVRQFIDSRSSLRQGVLAQRRSTFQGNQFPKAIEVARKAAVTPIYNGVFTRNRGVSWNKPRFGAPPSVRKARNGGFAVKTQQQHQRQQQQMSQGNLVFKERPQTLDARFANIKEQRMRVFSAQNNGARHGGFSQQRQRRQRGQLSN